jgi:hypothetical protein
MTFAEIEIIIADKLPDSARLYSAWWANDPTHVQATAWLNAGWKVDSVNKHQRSVTFVSSQ